MSISSILISHHHLLSPTFTSASFFITFFRAVLVYPPSLDFMVAFLACLKAGVVAVPVFPPNPLRRDTLNMFAKIVEGCDAKYALTNSEYNHAKKIAGVRDAWKLKKTAAAWPDDLKWLVTDDSAIQASSKTTTLPKKMERSSLAFLQYTSGSTSAPKGVMITVGNLAHNLRIITNELKAVEDTVVVSWLPQYHDMGLIGSYLGVLYCGGSGYYMSPLSFLQRPMLWIEAVSKYKATHLQAPNFAFKLTARKSSQDVKLDLSSVRHIINAAEPVDQESIDSFYKAFCPFGLQRVIYPTYGLAEHTVFVCSGGKQILNVMKTELETQSRVVLADDTVSDPLAITKLVGCGFPAHQNVDVKIVNTESLVAEPENVVGEIWVSSPSKAAGYYGKEQETKDDFHATIAPGTNPTEYLRTGDLGFLHNDELFICGRLKDLIIVGGRNYYPQDIEATAEATSDELRPGCSAAFTIDPTHEGGEEVALVMELRDVPTASKLKDVCLPLAEKVRSAVNQEHSLGLAEIVFVKTRTIPKTSSGKIARSWCRKGFVNGTLEVVFRQSFKSSASSFEIETENGADAPKAATAEEAAKIRGMERDEIRKKLVSDICRLGSVPPESLKNGTALITVLDSLTISQLKGLLENSYAVKISDEYLFRESTTIIKLVEVIKLGYAPDDDGGHASGDSSNKPSSAPSAQPQGTATGLAGALGCPPGVVCVIL